MNNLHTAKVTIVGVSPYSQGQVITEAKERNETHDAFERRTWKQRMKVRSGAVVVNPIAVKRALEDAAKFSGATIPGKGKSTYTKRFLSGVMLTAEISIGKEADITGEWYHVPSNGVRGGGKRVMKCFPMIPPGWGGTFEITVMDEAISKEVLQEHLEIAGTYIGLGRFRPQNGGYYGRFEVKKLVWK